MGAAPSTSSCSHMGSLPLWTPSSKFHHGVNMMPPSCGCLDSLILQRDGITSSTACWFTTVLPSGSSWRHWRRNRTWSECSFAGRGSWRNLKDEQLNGSAMMTRSRNYATYSTDRQMWLFFWRKLLMFVKFMLLVNIILCFVYDQSIQGRRNGNRVKIESVEIESASK